MEHGTLPRRAELVKFQSMFLTFPEGFFQTVGLDGWWGGGSSKMEKWQQMEKRMKGGPK